jgi:hypothetical protein
MKVAPSTWNSPKTWVDEKPVTIAQLNLYLKDVQNYLYECRAPSGIIMIWTGTIANIPSGWVICDGNNATPNLLTKFVEGVASAITDPGTTGGAVSKTSTGHSHTTPGASVTIENQVPGYYNSTASATCAITDIRPPYYDVAYIMKS